MKRIGQITLISVVVGIVLGTIGGLAVRTMGHPTLIVPAVIGAIAGIVPVALRRQRHWRRAPL